MIPIRKIALRVLASMTVAVAIGCCNRNASAQALNPYSGDWISRGVTQISLVPGCTFLEVRTFRLALTPGMNQTSSGQLFRSIERVWWTKMHEECRLPGEQVGVPGVSRIDGWVVTGQPVPQGRLRIVGVVTDCVGQCALPGDRPLRVEATLSLDESRIRIVGGPPDFFPSTTFTVSGRFLEYEASAQAQLGLLLRPLLEGNCNQFYLQSLDIAFRLRAPADKFCTVALQISALIPHVIRESHGLSYGVSLGQARGALMPLLLTEGDVIARRYFVVTDAGGNVPIGAAMRRQADGSWRILDLVP